MLRCYSKDVGIKWASANILFVSTIIIIIYCYYKLVFCYLNFLLPLFSKAKNVLRVGFFYFFKGRNSYVVFNVSIIFNNMSIKFGSSLAFLNKKCWHSSARESTEKIWKAESQTNIKSTASNPVNRADDVDTNVIAISFLDIDKESSLVTGDPLACSHCPAFLSSER